MAKTTKTKLKAKTPEKMTSLEKNSLNKESMTVDVDSQSEEIHSTQSDSESERQTIKIEFPYSELVREKVPHVFDVAETVATQWVNNEKFENIGLNHPLAEVAAVKALEKAKDLEKKLEEKGVITAAKMGFQLAKIQAENLVSKLKKN